MNHARSCVVGLAIRLLVMVCLASAAGTSLAAASGSVVFDPTNFAKNTQTSIATAQQVIQSIRQTAQQVAMVQNQVTMTKKMIDDIRGLNVAALRGIVDPQTFEMLSKLSAAHSAYTGVHSDLSSMLNRFQLKQRAAEMSGLPLDRFVASQYQAAAKGSRAAREAISRDIEVMKSTERSARAASKWRDEIGGLNDNLGGSMQLMNTQLSSVVAQNAEMLGYMARVNAEAASQRANQNAEAMERLDVHVQSLKDVAAEERFRTKNATGINGEVINPWKR